MRSRHATSSYSRPARSSFRGSGCAIRS
jgi:hypothetical protein